MGYPPQKWIRPLEDDEVDRAWVQVQQCTQLNATNRSKAYPGWYGNAGKEDVQLIFVFGFEGILLRI